MSTKAYSMKNRLFVLLEKSHNEAIFKQKPFWQKEVTGRDHMV